MLPATGALGLLACRKVPGTAQILRETHHDDQNQGPPPHDACRLCCSGCHGTLAYSSRAHPPRGPSIWLRRLPVWWRLPVVSKPRIWSRPSALLSLSGMGLRNRRRRRPVPSMRDGGWLAHGIGSPPFTRYGNASQFSRDSGAVATSTERPGSLGRARRHFSCGSVALCHPSPSPCPPGARSNQMARGSEVDHVTLQRC